jgi:hypothetical protein
MKLYEVTLHDTESLYLLALPPFASASGFFRTLISSLFLVLTAMAQSSDTTAPILTAFSFTPTSINTASAPATVQASFSATDDLSGIQAIAVTWFNPNQSVWYGNTATFNGPLQTSGTVSVTLPQFSQSGIWTPDVELVDMAGNMRLLSSSEIAALGFPTQLTVASVADVTAPILTAFSFTPTSVVTASAPATVQASFSATDDLSGIQAIAVTWFNPNQSVWYGNTATFNGPLHTSGTVSVTLPQFSQSGTWTPEVELVDMVGNMRLLSSSEIAALGFPTQLTVASAQLQAQVSTTASGLAYSRVTKTFNGTVTIKNISTTTLIGPFQIVFTALPPGITLTNATGKFSGSPFMTVPNTASLASGQSATINVRFQASPTTKVTFTPVVYSGSF